MTDDITHELAETLKELRTKFDSYEHLGPSMVRVDAALELYEDACNPKMTINLKDYANKLVVVTLRNEWMLVSLVNTNVGYDCYPYSIDGKNYGIDGQIFIGKESPYDIIDIKLAEEDPEPSMIDMCGGSTPIVPEETIDEWKKVGLIAETNKQTAPDIIEINGVKYQRVEEPPKILTLWKTLYNKKFSDDTSEDICEIVEKWIPQYSCDWVVCKEYLDGYTDALNNLKANLK
jgi:hypothetical protein